MSNQAVVIIVVVMCVGVAYIAGLVVAIQRRVSALLPGGIVKRLNRKKGSPHVVRVRSAQRAWDPTKPVGRNGYLYGPGVATYTLGDDGLVHMVWNPEQGKGQILAGPIPDQLRPGSPQRRTTRKALRIVGLTYIALSGIGFGLGWVLSTGSDARRLGFGGLGVFVGWVLIYVVVIAIRIGTGARSHSATGPNAGF